MQETRRIQEPMASESSSMSTGLERRLEEQHLEKCIQEILQNIDKYMQEYKDISAETKELYDNYRSANPELHNDLVIGLGMKTQIERNLNKNLLALKKPYFGRIDYKEVGDRSSYSLYLGKNGVRRNITENMIIDWRAPISGVYYESDIGRSSYPTPMGDRIEIDLFLKRTYEIENSKLIDYYDSDVVANDEFLTKYLSKNKEVVLGEIIATIQKEQNEIIRDVPWHNVIVQGVAGSGKTTVAMHRISYILYNYKEKFRPDEFYIIGSNKMLLNYITGVLPNLDVYNVNQITMEEFLISLLDKDFDYKKGKYTLTNSFLKLKRQVSTQDASTLKRFKGSNHFIKALIVYMKQYEIEAITTDSVRFDRKVVYSKDEILYFLDFFEELPLQEKIDLLNKRLTYKVKSLGEDAELRKEKLRSEVNRYKNYFGNKGKKYNLMEIYISFLEDLQLRRSEYLEQGIKVAEGEVIELLLTELKCKHLDIYDLGMLNYIKRRIKMTKDYEYVGHIVIDEAQDFGVMLFQIFKQLFKNCTYTIMGDVSQNIYYDTGMNDWEVLKQEVFHPEKDRFYVLAKSYRNTVEISDYASKVLSKCSFKTYDIEPIIRHGKEVGLIKAEGESGLVAKTVELIKSIRDNGYDTIAIICRTVEETLKVKKLLSPYVPIEHLEDDIEEMTFSSGNMVLPIHMTKGLEFDSVIIWNPEEESYHTTDEDAKLLYVAITRALHELHIVYQDNLSGLLK
ncbi:MAG: ATP-dependent helicase rep [Herbinix sp.]|nr:ATP-dependent helicase rep [Herbinix sp.]